MKHKQQNIDKKESEMIASTSFTWHDIVAIAAVVGSCVASILIFAIEKGGGR